MASVKDIKHLRKNLELYSDSDNPHIRAAYNKIRVLLGRVLREIAALRKDAELERGVAIVDLDSLRLEIKRADVLSDGYLDRLIRKHLVTPEMSTSLINDSAYAHSSANHLIDMAEIAFQSAQSDSLKAERHLSLTPEELEQIATDSDSGAPTT